jgi:hypothetical protein
MRIVKATKVEKRRAAKPARVRVNVGTQLLQSGSFVFNEVLSQREKRQERRLIVPYAFPDSTAPVSSVLWFGPT